MAIARPQRDTEADPFYDMLFNMLIAFVLCFIVALLAFRPQEEKKGDVPLKAEFMITVSWPDGNPNDIDTWVRDPSGQVLWFRQRDVGLMHLDRDDRGDKNNTVLVDGKTLESKTRQEIATLRGSEGGEYIVNAHYFDSKDKAPVDVQVQLIKINPQAQIVFTGQARLAAKGEEQTLVRFTLDQAGNVTGLDTRYERIVEQAKL